MKTFADLGLAPQLVTTLEQQGYQSPTPIQAQAIPSVLTGRDLLGIAQTGTGKTAAFALPIIQRLAANKRAPLRKGCRVLVLSPTRELASQIAESFRTYARGQGLTVAVVFGGVGHRPQIQAMARGVDVLVATPGRLIDHMDERNIDIAGTEIFVLDEADQMLDLGFVKPIRRIVSKLSIKRQSLFFSATMPREIGELASELLNDPARVSVAPAATTVERVAQRVIEIEHAKKRSLLVELLRDETMARTIIFTRTKRGADRVAAHLCDAGIQAAAIHGNKSQQQRERALMAFKDGGIRVMVATDIAARGIDIDAVSHVVNYELPEVPESYVHRIGRTARAGATGIAISLVDNEEKGLLRDIERVTRQSLPTEDRRNDPNLKATSTSTGSRPRTGAPQGRSSQGGGHRHHSRDGAGHGAGHGAGTGGHRGGGRGGQDRRGDRRPGDRQPDRHGDRSSEGRHAPVARDGDFRASPSRPDRDGRGGPSGHRRGNSDRRPDRDRQPRGGDGGHGLERVGFMARPSRGR